MRLDDDKVMTYLASTRRYPSISIPTADLESLLLEVLDARREKRLAACAITAALAPDQESPT